MNTLKKSNNFTYIIVGLIVGYIFFKDLSLALGQTNRISLSLAAWVPVLVVGLFSSIGILQINENKIFIIIFLFWSNSLMSETLNIKSSSITIDKKTEMTQFKGNVIAKDEENNILKTEHAEYDKDLNILFAKGKTDYNFEKFSLQGEDIIFDNKNNLIKSNKPTIIKDLENNEIFWRNLNIRQLTNF